MKPNALAAAANFRRSEQGDRSFLGYIDTQFCANILNIFFNSPLTTTRCNIKGLRSKEVYDECIKKRSSLALDNRNRSGFHSTPGWLHAAVIKDNLLQMEVRNLQRTRRQPGAKRGIQQPQLTPGSSDQLHSDLKQGGS